MALSANAQALADEANTILGQIDTYTAAKINEAETALSNSHAEDLAGVKAALDAVAARIAIPAGA